jgi:uncharacterized protein YuzE
MGVDFVGHYDRSADIAWLVLPGFEGAHTVGHPEPWGLREVDERTGQLVALEFWEASTQLPRVLLDALPAPRAPAPAAGP